VSAAVDSSVLWSIFKGEPAGVLWLEKLIELRQAGPLLVCEVVWAETRPAFATADAHDEAMSRLRLDFSPLDANAAALAGELFSTYRRAGGGRQRILPDFLIGAHALSLGVPIASDDEGFFRRYFHGLRVVKV
jgi:predicted nucleic acid-binding protein